MRLDHLRLELDLPNLLVCLVKEPVGEMSQGQSPILKLLRERVPTFDNASSENGLPERWYETSEETSTFWLVRDASFTEFNCLVSVLEQVESWIRKRALIETAVFTRPDVQLQTVLRNISWFMRDNQRKLLGKRTIFRREIGGAGFWHYREDQNEKKRWEWLHWYVSRCVIKPRAMRIVHAEGCAIYISDLARFDPGLIKR